jgi:hypothetical protein
MHHKKFEQIMSHAKLNTSREVLSDMANVVIIV